MKYLILYVAGLFSGLFLGYILLKGKIDNLQSQFETLVQTFKSKTHSEPPSISFKKLQKDGSNDELKSALKALGFSASEADEAIANISNTLSLEDKIKLALQYFNKKGQ